MRILRIVSFPFLGIIAAAMLAGAGVAQAPLTASQPPTRPALDVRDAQLNPRAAFTAAFDYVVTFYPRWFTYHQVQRFNRLVGPERINPTYQAVVAINDDTLYASAFIASKTEPVIVTVPATSTIYSVLQLDGYGNVFPGIPGNQPGVYALVSPEWHGPLPAGITPVVVPYDYTVLIFRADKYSAAGQDLRTEADRFRRSLHLAALSAYLVDPSSGPTVIGPVEAFATPYKLMADDLVEHDTLLFLTQLQTAVLAPTTQPLTPDEQVLSLTFNDLFGDGNLYPQLIAGAKAGHAAIVRNYLTHTIQNSSWITFANIGEWDTSFGGYLDRSAIAEYIQYGNNHKTAAYYQTFLDAHRAPLDGHAPGYMMTFAYGRQPDVSRFWSLTAYLPESIELVPNAANKYVVASYTPGLVTDPDGSVTILMSSERPLNFPEANWLPVPRGRFNVMLRAYGPEGIVLENTYVPPPIERARRPAF